jgi:hypothetical protein
LGTLLTWKDPAGATVFVQFDVVTHEEHEGSVTITEHPVEDGPDVADHARPQAETITVEGFVSNSPLATNLFSGPATDLTVEEGWDFTSVDLDLRSGLHGALQTVGTKQVKLDIPSQPFQVSSPVRMGTALITAALDALSGPPEATVIKREERPPTKQRALVLKTTKPKDRVRAVFEKLSEVRVQHRMVRVETKMAEYDNMMIEKVSLARTPEDGNGGSFTVDLKRVRIVKSETVDAPKPVEPRGSKTVAKGSKLPQELPPEEDPRGRSLSLAGVQAIFDKWNSIDMKPTE